MTYHPEYLTSVAGACKSGVQPGLWMYWNKDNDTMTEQGFISLTSMHEKDVVMVINENGSNLEFYYVTDKSEDKITLASQT